MELFSLLFDMAAGAEVGSSFVTIGGGANSDETDEIWAEESVGRVALPLDLLRLFLMLVAAERGALALAFELRVKGAILRNNEK